MSPSLARPLWGLLPPFTAHLESNLLSWSCGKKKNGNEESRSNFFGAGYTTHLEFPPLIFLLGKKKPFSGHWESDFHYPLGSPTPFLEITPYFLQS